MARKYSVKSKSRRWLLQIFPNILDLAEINGSILYKETRKEISRQDFLFQLREELATERREEKQLRKEGRAKTITLQNRVPGKNTR